MLFFANSSGPDSGELWVSDGTPGGTTRVRDTQFQGGGLMSFVLTAIDGTLFFSAFDGNNGYELWRSDGTTKGTAMLKDI
jgi:ELWxxDGT repeat protein